MTGSVVFGDIVQITGVGGDVTVNLDRPPYRVAAADDRPVPVSVQRARAQPSRLLLARHQIVPFTGRERTLDTLAAWIGGHEPVAARLVHATGGQGKTRLAAHVGMQCAVAGWAVWQVTYNPTPIPGTAGAVSEVALPGGAVLAVVDYADRWPASALLALLTALQHLHTRTGTRVRVLMLARSDGYWWPALADRADSDLGIEADQSALPALAADSDDDRASLFTTAAGRFAAALNVEPADWPVPELTGPEFGQVLAVHMAALAAVDAARHGRTPPTSPAAVSAYLLRREQAYWQQLHTRAEAPVRTAPDVMHRAVVVATLTGAQPRPAGRQALARAGFADTGTADRIIDDHATCYPTADGRTVFEPLHPDRLGEDLIALSTPGHDHDGVTSLERDWAPATITGLLTATGSPPAWASPAVTVLVEAARRWPHLATGVLYPIIREHPQLIIAAGGATLTRLTGIPHLDPGILETLEPLLPVERLIDFDIAAAAISSALIPHCLARTSDPAARARLHAVHAYRLTNAGRREQALTAAEEAVSLYRQSAQADPTAYLPDIAMSLHNVGNLLSELGRREQALAPAQEAVDLYRQLAAADPAAYLPGLATSVNKLGNCLSDVGRRDLALAPAQEALSIRRQLAATDPDTYLPDLAGSLNDLGNRMSELNRRAEAVAMAEEAVSLRRRLAAGDPDAHLPGLAMSLSNLGSFLSNVDRHEEALSLAEEAVDLYRRLAAANPAAYLPGLARSVNNLGNCLSAEDRREFALASAQEAVDLYRGLAAANPAAYLPGLATSVNNLGNRLWGLGKHDQFLAPAQEALSIRRRLVMTDRDAHLPGLAALLNDFGIRLSELGRREQAMALAEEAADLYRQLATAEPDAYLPNLAMSLWAYAQVCVNVNANLPQAVAAAIEAIDLYQSLAQQSPGTYAGQWLAAHRTLADVLDGLGRTEDAVNVRRQLERLTSG